MLKRDEIIKKPSKIKLPDDVDLFRELEAEDVDIDHFLEIFAKLANHDDLDGSTKVFETRDMAVALDVLNALTWFHGEAEFQKNDETGDIKVFSLGKGKGRFTALN